MSRVKRIVATRAAAGTGASSSRPERQRVLRQAADAVSDLVHRIRRAAGSVESEGAPNTTAASIQEFLLSFHKPPPPRNHPGRNELVRIAAPGYPRLAHDKTGQPRLIFRAAPYYMAQQMGFVHPRLQNFQIGKRVETWMLYWPGSASVGA